MQRQQEMTLTEMLADLPQSCAVGTKRNAQGLSANPGSARTSCTIERGSNGARFRLSCILQPPTGLGKRQPGRDSSIATMTAERVTNLYDLDRIAAYDAAEIRAHSESLGRCADHRCQSAQQQCHIQAGN